MSTRYLALGKETTFGTAATPTIFIDAESAAIDPAGSQSIIYQGASGLDYLAKPGAYRSSGSFVIPVDDKMFGHILKWGMGGYQNSSGTHIFKPAVGSLMETFTTRVGKDNFEHVFTGCAINSIGITISPTGFVVASVDIVGGKDEKGTLLPTITYTTGETYSGSEVVVKVANADFGPKLDELNLTLNFNADNDSGVTIGSRYPRRVYRGAFGVDLSMNLAFFDTSELERFWGNATGPANALQEFEMVISIGDNIDISIPRAIYDSISQPLSGRDRITQSATVRALRTLDGIGPVQISMTNDIPTY